MYCELFIFYNSYIFLFGGYLILAVFLTLLLS